MYKQKYLKYKYKYVSMKKNGQRGGLSDEIISEPSNVKFNDSSYNGFSYHLITAKNKHKIDAWIKEHPIKNYVIKSINIIYDGFTFPLENDIPKKYHVYQYIVERQKKNNPSEIELNKTTIEIMENFRQGKASRTEDILYLGNFEIYDEPNYWAVLMIDNKKQTIAGYYYGYIRKNKNNILFSNDSFITIQPEYLGKGLCKKLASVTYKLLFDQLNIEFIFIQNVAHVHGCRCYVNSAKENNYYVYGIDSKKDNMNINDCPFGYMIIHRSTNDNLELFDYMPA